MQYRYSLSHLTLLGCTPTEFIYIASRAGYDFVSLRLIPMGVPGESGFTLADKEMVRRTKITLDETGMTVHDLELARIVKEVEPREYEPAMEVAAEWGAHHVISSVWTTDSDDKNFIIERYAELCDLAKPYGLTVDLEFPTFSRISSLQEAIEIVSAAGRDNCGILLDTLYFHFSRMNVDELKALPPEWVHFAHICDTIQEVPSSIEGMKTIAREDRLYPGEGCIDFQAILSTLPTRTLSIELPNLKRVQEIGYEGHARRCLESTKNYLTKHPYGNNLHSAFHNAAGI